MSEKGLTFYSRKREGIALKRGLNLNWAGCTSDISQSLDSLILTKDDSKYISDAINNNAEQKKKWLKVLKEYIRNNEGKIINGDFIEKVWFPDMEPDIFISHSHIDEKIALKMKFLLEKKFDLSVFVDSVIWGNANDLLWELDNIYCQNSENHTYSYEKRNNTTAIIHLMLADALMKIMDKSSYIFFLNTLNSTLDDGYGSEEQVTSPWIYHELVMTKYLQDKQRMRPIQEGRDIRVSHTVDLSHLYKMDFASFQGWVNLCTSKHYYKEKALGKLDDIISGLCGRIR